MDGSNWNEPEVNDYQGEHSLSMVMLVDPEAGVGDEKIESRSVADINSIDDGTLLDPGSPASLDQTMEDPITSDMNETREEISDEQTQHNDSTATALNVSEAVEENTVNVTQTSQRSLLRRIYTAQVNPPKEPHMRALKFERFWPRSLRRVASAPQQEGTLAIVE
jgi:hypothetical protein